MKNGAGEKNGTVKMGTDLIFVRAALSYKNRFIKNKICPHFYSI
jgi:hypothetical protein